MTSAKLQSIWPVEPEPISVSLTSALTCRLSLPLRSVGLELVGRDQVGAQGDAAVLALWPARSPVGPPAAAGLARTSR